jgi:hypothetical protein
VAAGAVKAEVQQVPVPALLPGESPRLDGLDKAHIMRLAEVETPLPAILVDRRSMRVIDGMHRLMAAILKGRQTIEVEFFEGSAADAFLRGVEANVAHGFPLSQADRRAAAIRIIGSHPHLSDRAIAEVAGLGAKTVAALRRDAADVPRFDARVGKDGKVRPLNAAVGRRRAAELIAERPEASLREVARGAGVSLATASDVRKRLARGDDPVPPGSIAGPREAPAALDPAAAARHRVRRRLRVVHVDPGPVLDKLQRDPSLRLNEAGRQLLLLLRHNAVGTRDRSDLIAAVPPHCGALIRELAGQYARMWLEFAQELDSRGREPVSVAVNN